MSWFALLLLIKFEPPGWFYFMKYAFETIVSFGVENTLLKYGGSQGQESNVSRPLFFLAVVAGEMICFHGWKQGLSWGEKLSKKGSVKQTTFSQVLNLEKITSLLRGNCTSNQKLASFALYLKIVNIFLKNQHVIVNCPRNSKKH